MTNKDKKFAKDINVPRKEPIMIDGIDVSECDHFREGYCHPGTGVCYKCDTNCQYAAFYLKEQLARKTAECELLETQLESYHIGEPKLIQRIQELEHECEQIKEKYEALKLENEEGYEIVAELKHKCEELEKLVQQAQEAPICFQCEQEPCIRQERDRYRKALEEIEDFRKKHCDFLCEGNRILDIINKAKEEK